MKGSRVQAIIKELRGEKIDIIEWSDEPSVFAANALSPAKVSQVRITDINKRKMEVIVAEDQLSLAIGKKGQNVRLATRLVGWDIDIVSEEVLKKEIALQMGRMMASGEAVPLTALEGVSPSQAESLAEHNVTDVETLAQTSVDDLVEFLDVSLDEAESIRTAAAAVVAASSGDAAAKEGDDVQGEDAEQPAASVEDAEAAATTPDAEVEAETEAEAGAVSQETTETSEDSEATLPEAVDADEAVATEGSDPIVEPVEATEAETEAGEKGDDVE
jgi:N utilization substance protein A